MSGTATGDTASDTAGRRSARRAEAGAVRRTGRRRQGGVAGRAGEGGTSAVLHVDWTRCDGRGLCSELLERVGRDDWGYPRVPGLGSDVPLSAAELAAAHDAVALCPRQALSLR